MQFPGVKTQEIKGKNPRAVQVTQYGRLLGEVSENKTGNPFHAVNYAGRFIGGYSTESAAIRALVDDAGF